MKTPMLNRGVPLRVPHRQILTTRGQGRLQHNCAEDAMLWEVEVAVSETDTARFGCPKCRHEIAAGRVLPNTNYPPGTWFVHCGLIFGTRSLRLHTLECPTCQALGDIKPATAQAVPDYILNAKPKDGEALPGQRQGNADQEPPDPNKSYAKPTVGQQRFGVKALHCATCKAVRLVDPGTGILETEVEMEQGVYGLDKTH